MSDQTAIHQPPTSPAAETWVEDDLEELPPRPRRRLLAPLPLALMGILLIACGFIAGVLVEKGQTSSSSSGGAGAAAGLASRFAALRGAPGGGPGGPADGGAGTPATGAASGFGAGAGRGATVGQVAYIDGSTLYVTTLEGNTVKVKTSATSTVTKTVTASVKAIHPGETVVVTGSSGANGKIDAESIRVGGAGGGGGGIGALFGDGGAAAGGAATGGAGNVGGGNTGGGNGGDNSSGGGEPALFGKGG